MHFTLNMCICSCAVSTYIFLIYMNPVNGWFCESTRNEWLRCFDCWLLPSLHRQPEEAYRFIVVCWFLCQHYVSSVCVCALVILVCLLFRGLHWFIHSFMQFVWVLWWARAFSLYRSLSPSVHSLLTRSLSSRSLSIRRLPSRPISSHSLCHLSRFLSTEPVVFHKWCSTNGFSPMRKWNWQQTFNY